MHRVVYLNIFFRFSSFISNRIILVIEPMHYLIPKKLLSFSLEICFLKDNSDIISSLM